MVNTDSTHVMNAFNKHMGRKQQLRTGSRPSVTEMKEDGDPISKETSGLF